jgi:hypothetical protein
MQFITLPKPIDSAERLLPELVADWVDTLGVKSTKNIILQQVRVNMLDS